MSLESGLPVNQIEKTANYEGDWTLLFLERLNNPEVKRKLIESLSNEHIYRYYKKNPKKGAANMKYIREKVEKELEERINTVFSVTNVNFKEKYNPAYGDFGKPGWICPNANPQVVGDPKDPDSKRFLNIAESHEKGHGVRKFAPGSPVSKWINSSFDVSETIIPEEDINDLRKFYNARIHRPDYQSKEDITRFYKETWLKDNADEIVERMSQLKNYFGMKGDEKFTKQHLEYAKEHYINDIGFPVQIRLFLDSITPATEKNFLDVINNLGV